MRRIQTHFFHLFTAGVVMLLLGAGRAGQKADDLAVVFKNPESWQRRASDFATAHQLLYFHLLDEHTAVSTATEHLRFLKLPVYEVRVHFEQDVVRRVEVSLYNKGDAGEKDHVDFKKSVKDAKAAISAFAGNVGIPTKATSPRPNYFVHRHQWIRHEPAIQLEWAFVHPHRSGGRNIDFSAEYINVLLVPNDTSSRMASASAVSTAQRLQHTSSIKENICRKDNDDVWVDNIPMVDQGQKGYCAAATSERVLRYYGLDIDQHKVAQIADTAAQGGTSIQGMLDAITIIGRKFQLDRSDLVSARLGGRIERSSYGREIDQYNKEARRQEQPTIDWKTYVSDKTIDLNRVWADMNPDVLLASKVNQTMAFERFFQDIKHYTDQGVPLMWSCLVGMYPENPAIGQTGAFGHVRLIIGYNEQTREVLYSDSWGSAHALKRMPVDQAWAMTKTLFVLKPRNVR